MHAVRKSIDLPNRAGAGNLSRRGKANSNSASALLLELKEVKGMFYLPRPGRSISSYTKTKCSRSIAMSLAIRCIV